MNNPPIKTIEKHLQQKVLPELEKGRPNFDKPHTIATVKKLKEIIKNSPELDLDTLVLIIAAYTHDWGYCELFKDGKAAQYKEVAQAKTTHMDMGAKEAAQLLKDKTFDTLTNKQKARIVHLVKVHDKLDQLQATDEIVLMEADTLGSLDADLVKPTFNAESNKKFIKEVRKLRLPKFITKYGKKDVERLIEKRMEYYKNRPEV